MAQSQISRTLRDEASVSRISLILSQESFDSRRSLGRRICEEFSFVGPSGRLQLAGCLKALAELADRRSDIVLPAPASPAVDNRPRLLGAGVPEPEGVPARLAGIDGLEFRLVEGAGDRAVWNTLMATEHPHGMATFAGQQLRYLVGSDLGCLGAAGFSAAALRVSARDRWIGWDDGMRRDNLHRVVCLNRFLIRPSVALPAPGQPCARPHPASASPRLPGALRSSAVSGGELRRRGL